MVVACIRVDANLEQQVSASFNVTAIRAALADRAAEVATALLGQPNHRLSSKQEIRFGSRGSFAVVIAGIKAGSWYDHENGVGGDLFTLIRRVVGGDFVQALEYVESIIGYRLIWPISRTSAHHRDLKEDQCLNHWRALALWQEAVPIVETIVIRYLAKRRILDQALAVDTTMDDSVTQNAPFCVRALYQFCVIGVESVAEAWGGGMECMLLVP